MVGVDINVGVVNFAIVEHFWRAANLISPVVDGGPELNSLINPRKRLEEEFNLDKPGFGDNGLVDEGCANLIRQIIIMFPELAV